MTLPARWEKRALGEVASTELGKMLDRGNRRGLPEVPYLRNVNVQWDRIDAGDVLTMELANSERERFAVEPGDLLVCEGGEIGRAAIWRGNGQFIAYQKALHRVRPSGAITSRFLLHLFRHLSANGQLAAHATGTTIAHLSQQRLRRVPIPVPPIEEQRRIVDILEDHLSRLDAATRGLSSVTARIRSLTAVVLAAETQTFEAASLASLATQSGYGTSTKCVVAGPGPAVARIPNLVDGRIEMLDEKRVADPDVDVSNFMLNEGDLLIVRTNGSRELIGRSAVVQAGIEAAFASYLIRFKFDAKRVLPAWVNAVLGNPSTRERLEGLAASSTGQYNLSLGKLGPVPIPLPALAEQERILAKVQDHVTATSRLQGEVCRAVERSAQLRRGLLQAAFSGQLTGRSSDLDRAEEAVG